jgi:hypothetical protein
MNTLISHANDSLHISYLVSQIENLEQEFAHGSSRTLILPQLLVLRHKLKESSPELRKNEVIK